MRSNFRETFQILQKCIITTSTPLLAFYEKVVSNSEVDGLFIYSCLHEKSAETLPAAHSYEIIIDFNTSNIYNIVVTILNRLLKFDCDLYVKILEAPTVDKPNIDSCIKLLRKLADKSLIRLEMPEDLTNRSIKGLVEHPLDNVTCFIGPGNTGKTSIMASVSELFFEEKQRVALLDLTKEHKLKGYLPHSASIFHTCINHDGIKQFLSNFQSKHDGFPHLYTYDTSTKYKLSETAFLCNIIKGLSESYDFVLINLDKHIVENFIDIFKLFTSIFVVHDCILNKIHLTHEILLSLQRSGIETQKTVSMIYNKVIKKASDIGDVEEKLIFQRDEKGHLIPLIDIKCMTLEIFHSKKIAIALNNKIMTKANVLNKASLNYIINIKRLYNSINNIKDFEYSDLQLNEFVRNHVFDIAHNFFSMKLNEILQCDIKTKLDNIYISTKFRFERFAAVTKEIKDRYFKDKLEKVFK